MPWLPAGFRGGQTVGGPPGQRLGSPEVRELHFTLPEFWGSTWSVILLLVGSVAPKAKASLGSPGSLCGVW